MLHQGTLAIARMALAAAVFAAPFSGGAMGADLFRPLTIGGAEVRWLAQQSNPKITLRYAIANRDIVTADARQLSAGAHAEPLAGKVVAGDG